MPCKETEIDVMQIQGKEHLKLPEARKKRKDSHLEPSEEGHPC